ncbi:carbohydrate sulfotransferase 15-like isoform X2 [Amphiura filiformis]|uniref:carbohydrate sulfotransferase 15-like isoform X2 n=1 Tax=Amphiura filiformis TaxID=82378 RepID=UPI003B20DCC3
MASRCQMYTVTIITVIVLLYTIIASYIIENDYVPNKKRILHMRAKTDWFNNGPRPLKIADDGSVMYTADNNASNEYATEEKLWDNLLDPSYWTSEGSPWTDSVFYENGTTDLLGQIYRTSEGSPWTDSAFYENQTTDKVVQTDDVSPKCPERKPIVYTDEGRRIIPHELYNMTPAVFDTIPTQFMKGIRNPCWKYQNGVHCLPGFFLAGIAKCGTSDLWDKVSSHPGIGITQKESHWWSHYRKATPQSVLNHCKRYQSISRQIESGDRKDVLIGDGSPSTLWGNKFWREWFDSNACKEGPPYVMADVIHAVLPDSKILVILRNPADRLYSDYKHFMRTKITSQIFHNDVVQAMERFNTCLKSASQRSCAYPSNPQPSEMNVTLYQKTVSRKYAQKRQEIYPSKI